MMDWLLGHRSSLPLVLVVYMTLHVLARLFVSPVLDFDESEQVFLSQWFALGYNNQPPMYTWTQMGVFALMGCSVFSLTLLKNLHLFGTYLLTYGAVRTTTEDSRPATIAAVGMLTIPQIAWESHRDLTHTVGATFFVALLIYAVVRLAAKPHWCWYGLVGLATGMGMLSKYNFSLVILGVFVAAISLPRYRALILDRRIYLTISIAIALVVPHAVWMADHIGLASSRTLKSMTADASSQWLMNVAMGGFALVSCILGCLAFTLALFGLLWREGRADQISSGSDGLEFSDDNLQLGRLMERILVVIFGVLLLMVLSGSTTEFKNRWLQPFIFFVPAYLALKCPCLSRPRELKKIVGTGLIVMATVLVAVICRPMLSKDGKKPNELNLDYKRLVAALEMSPTSGTRPKLIIASDMRVAGNLRLQLPKMRVLSDDHPHLGRLDGLRSSEILIVNSRPLDHLPYVLREQYSAESVETLEQSVDWRLVSIPYLHRPDSDERATFHVGRATHRNGNPDSVRPIDGISRPAARIAEGRRAR